MGKRTWDGACARLGILATVTIYLAAVSGLALAAEPVDQTKAQPEPPSIYTTPVPAGLAKKIADAAEEVKKLNPLTEEQVLELKMQVEKVTFGCQVLPASYMDYLMCVGFGALPILEELLTSQNVNIRLNALTTLHYFIRNTHEVERDRLSETYPKYESLMILLCRRSYLDKSDKVRVDSVHWLGHISFQVMRRLGRGIELPAGASEALMQARQDTIPRIAVLACPFVAAGTYPADRG